MCDFVWLYRCFNIEVGVQRLKSSRGNSVRLLFDQDESVPGFFT